MACGAVRNCMLSSHHSIFRLQAFRTTPASRHIHAMAASAERGSSAGQRTLRVAHILLPNGSAALADELETQLQGGASFAELAQTHSSCSSKAKGGELGWLSRGAYFPEFEAAAFAAEVGHLARATTGRGLHLIKVLEERFQAEVQHMSVQELGELLSNQYLAEDVQFVDVREQWEYDTAKLPYFKLFPLSQYNSWGPTIAEDLNPQRETVVLCHHGVRSMQMSQLLVSLGFQDVKNVTGGIDAYSRAVDPRVPEY